MVVVIYREIGGSATNDGGIGMLRQLGYDFLDKDGTPCRIQARVFNRLRASRLKCCTELKAYSAWRVT